MKKHVYLLAALAVIGLAGCEKKSEQTAAAPTAPAPATHPPMGGAGMPQNPQMAQALALTQQGEVLSSIDVPQYTYIEVNQNGQTRWLAATTIAVKKGDKVQFSDGVTMNNFNSKVLNRTFPSITFVDRVTIAN